MNKGETCQKETVVGIVEDRSLLKGVCLTRIEEKITFKLIFIVM